MIFVDANGILRYLVQPPTPQDYTNADHAGRLFALLAAGSVEVTTSEATRAEVAFI
ncbi:MAG: hypothetical protein M3Q50_10385 [Chloroflexota bacterium]|nr:hypothetical protein [Chloroflexia bacterium]MDQ3227021.1 hypothetical protein [Chloroflexota bacterium]